MQFPLKMDIQFCSKSFPKLDAFLLINKTYYAQFLFYIICSQYRVIVSNLKHLPMSAT